MLNISLSSKINNYWFSNNYYSVDTISKFKEYFLSFIDLDKNITNENTANTILYDIQDSNIQMSQKYLNILLCVENCYHHRSLDHYIKYGDFGNKDINIYIYNHYNQYIETNNYIVVPVIYLQIDYFQKFYNNIHPSIYIPFKEKKFCLVVSNICNDNTKNILSILKNIGMCDYIKDFKNIIGHVSCYHDVSLLNLFNKYKFIYCIENSINDSYITEKIFNSYFSRTIPLYIGPNDKYRYFNSTSFIDINKINHSDQDKKNVIDKIIELNNNEIAFNNFINQEKINIKFDNQDYQSKSNKFIIKKLESINKDTINLDLISKVILQVKQQKPINLLDKFEFVQGKDIIGNDLYYYKSENIHSLLTKALEDKHCIGVNTLGFYKKEMGELKSSPYFGINDGIYIKKINVNNNYENNNNYKTVKLIGNFWDSEEQLINEFNLMCPKKDYFYNQIKLIENNDNLKIPDYYVIFNRPKNDNTYYDPKKTIVFIMEPEVMRQNWGKWRNPNKEDFLDVIKHETHLNNVQWRFKIDYDIYSKKIVNKNINKIASIISSKTFFEGHKLRINFIKYLEKKIDLVEIYGRENYHNFINYKGILNNDDPSSVLIPYKYYFMTENSSEKNYASEKIWEPILCECLTFYWGCPNLEEYIDSRAFVRLDLNNFEGSMNIIKKAIEEDWHSQRLDIIRKEKEKILNIYGFFPKLENIINNNK